MSSQSKLIKDILSTYDTILENKKVSEATDVYDNVDFKDYEVGTSAPSKDNINITLLQDIQTAAKNAGVKVDITTAISGHKNQNSRHPSGNAVDISRINGKKVSLSNRADADKLVGELVKMGYTKNSEGSSNPKAVLTFGFKDHDDHVHVSNTTTTPISGNTTGNVTTGKSGGFAREIGKTLLNAVGINEERVYSSFGKNYSIRHGEVIIPKDDNKKIKSPVSGIITSYSYNSNCNNQLVIKFEVDGNIFYLEYCGLSSISVRKGHNVSKGDVIGLSDSDIRVSLYNSNGNRRHVDTNLETRGNKNTDNSKNVKTDGMFTSAYKNFKNKDGEDNSKPKKNYNDGKFTSAYKTVRDTWFKKDKVQENIDRIKGLL